MAAVTQLTSTDKIRKLFFSKHKNYGARLLGLIQATKNIKNGSFVTSMFLFQFSC